MMSCISSAQASFRKLRSAASVVLASALVLGCTDARSEGAGTLDFTIWGEEYVETGIPSTDFADGWSVRFDKFLLVLGEVFVGDEDDGEAGRLPGSRIFDLAAPGPQAVGTLENVPVGTWDDVGYELVHPDVNTRTSGSVRDEDLAWMKSGPYTLHVEGSATREPETRSFAWSFSAPTRYSRCVAIEQGREVRGVLVRPAARGSIELTIHGDHLFYDDLASNGAALRFDAIALADADADGLVTLDELSRVRLVDIPEGTYGTGSAGDVNDLGAFVTALTQTLGHFRGEGHCLPSR